ncbi:hypothetical protein F7R25_03815 [Burkholderia stagnalis]|uniref:Uncharacterized protein n=1 Tax=Burkholderia stagnalis TaxID=1503054 RepID=A0A6L3N5D2_9BURK|nr:hypothetical protein [Burkholderia stagnalis]KAB0640631.1 hypothetical protein F7R25_03815 [Burkholderia stagnalis]VWB05725.1 hypothetical protein BST28156_00080 [Burkholderia stagnalis]
MDKKNNNKIRGFALSLFLAVAMLTGCNDQSDKKKTDEGDLFSMNLPAQQKAQNQPVEAPKTQADTNTPATAQQTVVDGSMSKIAYQKSSKSTSGQLAIAEYNKGHYYESVVSIVEGYRSSIYRDNIGVATGLGWNISFQSRATNAAITKAIGMSPSDQAAIIAISGNKNPSPSLIPHTSISPEQATKAAQVMRDMNFNPVAVRALGQATWDKLKPYQQAVVNYHVYKTGNLNWPHLKADIKACASTQSKADCKRAAEGFTYSYMLNGVRKYDTRSQLYMGALFQDPQAYAYLLGTTAAPADFNAVTASSGFKIDTTKAADPQVEAQDTFTPLKEQLLEEGKSFDLNVITPDREESGTKKKDTPTIHRGKHDVGQAVYLS